MILYNLKVLIYKVLLIFLLFPFLIIWGILAIFYARFSAIREYIRKLKKEKKKKEILKKEEKNIAKIYERLIKFKFNPRPIPSRFSTILKFTPDTLNFLIDTNKTTRCMFYPYPKDFKKVEIPVAIGVKLAGVLASHEDKKRPGLIFIHGLFATKNHDAVRQMALRAFYKWKYNVMAIDLRDFGETIDLSPNTPMFGSYIEGKDVVEVAKFFKEHTKTSTVGILGFSYGGATSLSAAYHSQGEIDGGVIAFCPYTDFGKALDYIDKMPSIMDPFFPIYTFFKITFLNRARKLKDTPPLKNFHDYISKVVLPHYNIERGKFFKINSPITYCEEIRTPTLVVHARDDTVVPVDHSLKLMDKAKSNPYIKVIITPVGGHFAHSLVAPRWTRKIIKEFFDYFADWGE